MGIGIGTGIVNELINKLYKRKLTKEDFNEYEDKYYFYKVCKKPDLSWDKK